MVTDRQTGKRKGYGFIMMTDQTGAARAINALGGTTIADRTLNVREAEEKKSAPTYRPPGIFKR